jgi:tRNA threonylcarbamoyladenosine biosynthesis protein TsaB
MVAAVTLLALDTSSAHGTVALLEGRSVRAEVSAEVDRHETSLLGRVDTLLTLAGRTKADISAVAVGTGPGGFTAVRVGIATAKGLCLALGCPIVGISSLAALARTAAPAHGVVATVVDAHRGEIFGALYFVSGEGMTTLVAPMLGAPDVVSAELHRRAGGMRLIAAGDALRAYTELPRMLGEATCVPEARVSAVALGLEAEHRLRTLGPDDLTALAPEYVRGADAKLPQKALSVAHIKPA